MEKITSKQLGFIIAALTIVSLKTYPTIYIVNGERDTWIAMIIASAIILLYLILSLKFFKNVGTYDLYTIYIKSFGKIIGTILYALYIFSLMTTLIECAGIESSSMHTNLLLETPIWYLLIFLTLPAIYVVKKGLRSIISVTLIGIILMTMAGINLGILTSTYKHSYYVFPVFQKVFSLDFLICIGKILGLYAHLTLAFPYIEHIEDKSKLLKHSIIGMIFVIQMQIVSVLGMLSTFQIERLKRLVYPKLTQTQLVSYWRFLESGEFFVMLQTIGGWYVKYILILNITLAALQKIKVRSKYNIYIITLIIFGLTNYIADDLLFFFEYLNLFSFNSLINFLIIPIIAMIIFKFKNKKKPLQKRADLPS
ncbi:endospore germination permease [Clostridium malenominatum]|uniref:Endospore germination permease n=1 Tax=Clostridium malenominatum TaxID=1539 RepID=A0ABN1IMG1_9CLOT